jgi:hypothetical protein
VHWFSPQGVATSISQAAELYEAGLSNGTLLFSGVWVAAAAHGHAGINRTQWDRFALPRTLAAEYYPLLGSVSVSVTTRSSPAGTLTSQGSRGLHVEQPAVGALVVANFRPRGCDACRTLVTRKRTDASGLARFGSSVGAVEVEVSLAGFKAQSVAMQVAGQQQRDVHMQLLANS